jgi:hypothetical protein
MPEIKIGERPLEARSVRAMSDTEWQSARAEAQEKDGDTLYFQVGPTVYEAVFAPETSLTAALHRAIKEQKLTIEFDGRSGTFLKSEDVSDRRWF